MRSSRHLLAASAALVVSLSAAQAWACSCKPGGPTRAQIVESAEYVFFGTATDLGQKKGPITISIDEVLKGDAGGRKVATLNRGKGGGMCEGMVPWKIGTTFLFITSDLDAMTSHICRQTIFTMSAPPADLDVWAGITASPDGGVDVEEPGEGDLEVDVEAPSPDVEVDVEQPTGDFDVVVEGGTEEKPADVTKASPRKIADAEEGDDPATTPKPASGGCASTSSSAGGESGGPVNAAFAFGVLLLGVGVRRRLR